MCKAVNQSHPAGDDGVCVHIRCDLMGLINHPDCHVSENAFNSREGNTK